MLVKFVLRSLFKISICIYYFPQVHSVNTIICSVKSLAITSRCIVLNIGNHKHHELPHAFWAYGNIQTLDFLQVSPWLKQQPACVDYHQCLAQRCLAFIQRDPAALSPASSTHTVALLC